MREASDAKTILSTDDACGTDDMSLPFSKVLLTAKLLRTVLPALYYASALFAMALHPVVRLSVCHKPEFC